MCNLKTLERLLVIREAGGMQEVASAMMKRAGEGAHWFDVWMSELSDEIQGVARAYGERIIM